MKELIVEKATKSTLALFLILNFSLPQISNATNISTGSIGTLELDLPEDLSTMASGNEQIDDALNLIGINANINGQEANFSDSSIVADNIIRLMLGGNITIVSSHTLPRSLLLI